MDFCLSGKGSEVRSSQTATRRLTSHRQRSALQKRADRSCRTTFGGLIRVEPHAYFTDAYQKVRNLLLSDDAEANSMPGLEILPTTSVALMAPPAAKSMKMSSSTSGPAGFRSKLRNASSSPAS